MKNSFYQREFQPQTLMQSSLTLNYPAPRSQTQSREHSHDHNIRRMSPAPRDRPAQAPTTLYPIHKHHNDYQITPRISQFHPSPNSTDNSKALQQLFQRIERLEAKNDKWDRLQMRVDRIQGTYIRLESTIDSLPRKEKPSRGKQNQMNTQNMSKKEDGRVKEKQDFITKDELQKQMLGLNVSFRNLLEDFKDSINKSVGDYHCKNKKKFVEITASQITQKMEQFKNKFVKDLNSQIQNTVKDSWSRECMGKTVMGLSRQKFTGTAVPLKMKQELTTVIEGVQKTLASAVTYYYIDKEGNLLDSSLHYLLDASSKEIKLNQDNLNLLRKQGLLLEFLEPPSFSPNLIKSHSLN